MFVLGVAVVGITEKLGRSRRGRAFKNRRLALSKGCSSVSRGRATAGVLRREWISSVFLRLTAAGGGSNVINPVRQWDEEPMQL